MSRTQKKLERPSLAQCFEGPGDEYVGRFGWLCGYSAQASFLDFAAELFTRQTATQRAHVGAVSLAIILDPGNAPISFVDAPGVAHLPIRTLTDKPFALLHAKVALLGFRHRDDAGDWLVRLIVTTGNWTRETMEESLDLVWSIDVRARDLNARDDETRRDCADIAAAHRMLQWLSGLFDTRLLHADAHAQRSESVLAVQQLTGWIDRCVTYAGRQPSRFIDNRKQSLHEQLPGKVRSAGVEVAGNRLLMGSGFFESASKPGAVPDVLATIARDLKREGVLSDRARVDVFVNPDACQSVATEIVSLKVAKMNVYTATPPPAVYHDGMARTLHAKFLFSANERKNSPYCLNAWVYLGSGNLTAPGFMRAASRHKGNLEAGVVFAPSPLIWTHREGFGIEQVLGNLLPVTFDEPLEPHQLHAGGDMPQRPAPYVAPPVAWLGWREAPGASEKDHASGVLRADDASASFDVIDAAGGACAAGEDGYMWNGPRPRLVVVRWQADGIEVTADIPVIDEFGRIAAAPLPALELDEAWWQLANFPMPPTDDGDGGDIGVDGIPNMAPARGEHRRAAYAVREMMTFIEQLADRQTTIAEPDWNAWCCRLEQTLALLADSDGVRAFRDLRLDPLQALRVESFRPVYAETNATPQGERYEDLLDRIGERWDVAGLSPIGDAS
jgi:hypothetical protein